MIVFIIVNITVSTIVKALSLLLLSPNYNTNTQAARKFLNDVIETSSILAVPILPYIAFCSW